MKKMLLILSVVGLAVSLNSCKKHSKKEVYANVPVYMDWDSFRSSFEFTDPVQLQNAGNIFIHNAYILVNDIDKGIHIFDNHDPYSPYAIGFMNIPGNTQMAVKNNTLYADSFTDLLTIDISNISNPTLVQRDKDVFSYALPLINEGYPIADIDKSQGVVVEWNLEMTNEVSGFLAKFNVKDCPDCGTSEVETKNAVSGRVDLAGSMSQFAIVDNYLYCLDIMDIRSFNISNNHSPVFGGAERTWQEPETLFPDPNGGYLYVGTTTGMMIYKTSSSPAFPDHLSTYEHVRSCDPVVVQGDYAYVTLRSGADCGGNINEYQVVDISNKSFPSDVSQFNMYDPHGLGIDGNLLFICDGDDGLKIFENSSPASAGNSVDYHFPDIKTKDIILNNGLAIMIAEDGVYQYDYSDPNNVFMVSTFYF